MSCVYIKLLCGLDWIDQRREQQRRQPDWIYLKRINELIIFTMLIIFSSLSWVYCSTLKNWKCSYKTKTTTHHARQASHSQTKPTLWRRKTKLLLGWYDLFHYVMLTTTTLSATTTLHCTLINGANTTEKKVNRVQQSYSLFLHTCTSLSSTLCLLRVNNCVHSKKIKAD